MLNAISPVTSIRSYPVRSVLPTVQPKKPSTISFGGVERGFKYFWELTKIEQEKVMQQLAKKYRVRPKVLTDFDTANVLEERLKRTLVKGELNVSSLSKIEKDKILDQFYDEMAVALQDKKFAIITGLPGSGKSSIVKELGFEKKYFTPDADKIKIKLPGFDKYGSDYVHKASTKLTNELIDDALNNGYNTVVQTTGWYEYITDLAKKAKENNYSTQAIHIFIDRIKSMQRAVERFEKGEFVDGKLIRRLVDPLWIKDKDKTGYVDGVPKLFKQLLKEGKIEKLRLYDNNGEFPPKLIEELLEV